MDNQSIKKFEVTENFKEANEGVSAITLGSHEENEMAIHGDKKLRGKASNALFTDKIKKEIQKYEFQTFFDIKDEIEEDKVKEIKIQPTIVCEPILSPPPPPPLSPQIDIQVKKNAVSKVNLKTVKKPRGRMGRKPRPILPMIRPIASASTSHLKQASTQHQLIVPSTQISGIAYQILLGDHGKNSNNPVQYTMLQPQPVFLQPSPSSVSNTSPVVISQSYPTTQTQVSSPKMVSQAYCSFCYKLFINVNEHVKECFANPESKNFIGFKFRKIAPATL